MGKNVHKHRFGRDFLLFFLIIIFVWWFNNYTLKFTIVNIKSGKIVNPMRIAVISDCHFTTYGINSRQIIQKVEKSEPDIVLLLGDMYTRNSSEEIMKIPVEMAKNLVKSGFPVYFVTGDHDTDADYIVDMTRAGARVMNYNSMLEDINGNHIRIIGIDNVYYSETFDLKNAFVPDKNIYTILMAHIPNYEKFSDFGADLTICADTHGGMVQLPFGLGSAIDPSTMEFFPEIRGKTVYDKGLFEYDGGAMFITSGIGASPVPLRFNNRPEIAVIDIKLK
ncbi:MAG: metallophosphoesterase [Ruminococcus sp.]|nr:metallophosphoesterase [Ruminococcus sp.]